jgi:hypothetical protein
VGTSADRLVGPWPLQYRPRLRLPLIWTRVGICSPGWSVNDRWVILANLSTSKVEGWVRDGWAGPDG